MPRGAWTEGSEGREAVFEKDSEPLPLENSRRETATPLAAVNYNMPKNFLRPLQIRSHAVWKNDRGYIFTSSCCYDLVGKKLWRFLELPSTDLFRTPGNRSSGLWRKGHMAGVLGRHTFWNKSCEVWSETQPHYPRRGCVILWPAVLGAPYSCSFLTQPERNSPSVFNDCRRKGTSEEAAALQLPFLIIV